MNLRVKTKERNFLFQIHTHIYNNRKNYKHVYYTFTLKKNIARGNILIKRNLGIGLNLAGLTTSAE